MYITQLKLLKVSFTVQQIQDIYSYLKLPENAVVLDPFAGAGTVGIVGSTIGYKTINIEIDKPTYKQMNRNFQQVKRSYDRRLVFKSINADSEIAPVNERLNAIVTSPPFSLSDNDNPSSDFGSYKNYYQKLSNVFKKYSLILNQDGVIAVLIGNDVKKDGTTEPIKRNFTNMMKNLNLELIETKQLKKNRFGAKWFIFKRKSRKIIDLTKQIKDKQKVWPGFPPVKVIQWEKKKYGKGWNGSKIAFPIHEVTHIDYPYHGINQGPKGMTFDLSIYTGIGRKITQASTLVDREFLLFPKEVPITNKIVDQIVNMKKIRFVCTEYDTLIPEGYGDGTKGHIEFLSRNILIIENLCNVNQLPDSDVNIVAFPLKVDCDGSPVRIIAFT